MLAGDRQHYKATCSTTTTTAQATALNCVSRGVKGALQHPGATQSPNTPRSQASILSTASVGQLATGGKEGKLKELEGLNREI